MKDVIVYGAGVYLLLGVLWILFNYWSRMAREDRARWRLERKYWKFVVAPAVAAIFWPLWVWVVWKIRKAIKSGEFDRIAREVAEEHRKKEHGESRRMEDL